MPAQLNPDGRQASQSAIAPLIATNGSGAVSTSAGLCPWPTKAPASTAGPHRWLMENTFVGVSKRWPASVAIEVWTVD